MTDTYHINPRFRAYGKARLDVTMRARDEKEWQQMWREPLNSFPFKFGSGWKFCFEYRVDDFAAEVGFYIDVLGFAVHAFSPHYAQFSSPGGELCISIVQASEGDESTPPDTIRLQLQIRDLERTSKELESRNITYEKSLGIEQDADSTLAGFFRTPHGVRYDLWDQSAGSSSVFEDEDDDFDYDDYDDGDYGDPRLELEVEEKDDGEVDGRDDSDDDLPLNLADLDEDEADRLLNELLGLSDESDDELDSVDDDVEYSDDDDELDGDEHADSHTTDPDEQPSLPSKRSPYSIKQSPVRNAPDRPGQGRASMSHMPGTESRRGPTSWPRDDDRRGTELTYGDLEDDQGYEPD